MLPKEAAIMAVAMARSMGIREAEEAIEKLMNDFASSITIFGTPSQNRVPDETTVLWLLDRLRVLFREGKTCTGLVKRIDCLCRAKGFQTVGDIRKHNEPLYREPNIGPLTIKMLSDVLEGRIT